ncbi:cell wall hydrolase [Acidovorax sp.]|jgi:N-acetylmuramoyl-L-alanine amidase|uniref:cell wall hydrolase n=1 Tax=Acidovorax sp. TaxID=1872122 RepID=UPI0027B8FF98|nr:cell wall hydrolase [Acidovorax sp.]
MADPTLGRFARYDNGVPGAAGLLVRLPADAGNVYLLGAAHVLTPLPWGLPALGGRVYTQDSIDGAARPAGQVVEYINIGGGGRYVGDAALVRLDIAPPADFYGELGWPKGASGITPAGMPVRMFSARANQVRTSTVCDCPYEASLSYVSDDAKETPVQFRDVIRCSPQYSQTGDSGSPVFNLSGQVVGIHFWGDSESGVIAPIGRLLRFFKAEVLTDPEAALGSLSTPIFGAGGAVNVINPASAVDVLARTLWAEARGENKSGIEAVACVVVNRTRKGGWWGDTVETVCRYPWQFSCWNPGTPSLEQLLRVTEEDTLFRLCQSIARAAIAGEVADVTKGACHYHRYDVQPDWSRGHQPSASIGTHRFFNDIA